MSSNGDILNRTNQLLIVIIFNQWNDNLQTMSNIPRMLHLVFMVVFQFLLGNRFFLMWVERKEECISTSMTIYFILLRRSLARNIISLASFVARKITNFFILPSLRDVYKSAAWLDENKDEPGFGWFKNGIIFPVLSMMQFMITFLTEIN